MSADIPSGEHVHPAQQDLGVLREPNIQPLSLASGLLATYHWEATNGAHTFLYLTLEMSPAERMGLARTNIDSGRVKGQGDALWSFIGTTVQKFSDQGFTEHGPCPIVHEVNTNEHSLRLPDSDPRYVPTTDRMKFLGLYLPNTLEDVLTIN